MADKLLQIVKDIRGFALPLAAPALAALLLSFTGGCATQYEIRSRPHRPTEPSRGVEIRVKAHYGAVNVRPTPSAELEPLTTVRGGDRLGRLRESGDWLKVSFKDGYGKWWTGWVYKYYVEGYEKPGATGNVAPAETSPLRKAPAPPPPAVGPSPPAVGPSPPAVRQTPPAVGHMLPADSPSPLGEPPLPPAVRPSPPAVRPTPELAPEHVPRIPQREDTISPL